MKTIYLVLPIIVTWVLPLTGCTQNEISQQVQENAQKSKKSEIELVWETPQEFKQPESVIYDSKRKFLYVSNINGLPTEEKQLGFISKVTLDGRIVDLNWITELNAPKGMAIQGDKLYVADINILVEIDIDSGQVTNRYEAPDSKLLNDLAIDKEGNVYVSDLFANTIYRLSNGNFELWLKSKNLDFPNGLYVDNERLIVATWGAVTNKETFATDVPGQLKAISLGDKAITSLGGEKPIGNLDGLEPDGKGNYYVTDWMAGKLLRITPSGDVTLVLQLKQGPSDHEYIVDQKLVIIPMMNENQLVAYRVPM